MRKGGIKHPIVENKKWCYVCQQYRPLEIFYVVRSGSLGRTSVCKQCRGNYQKEYQHRYYMKYREKLLPRHRVAAVASRRRKTGSDGVVEE